MPVRNLMRRDRQQNSDYVISEPVCCDGAVCEIASTKCLRLALVSVLAALIATSSGCQSAQKLPDKSSKEYGEVVSAFYVGLAALQVGDDVHAESKLSEVTRLVPLSPPVGPTGGSSLCAKEITTWLGNDWNGLAIWLRRTTRSMVCWAFLKVSAEIPRKRSTDLRKAAELNPQNLRAIYQLAEETERQGAADSDAEFRNSCKRFLRRSRIIWRRCWS